MRSRTLFLSIAGAAAIVLALAGVTSSVHARGEGNGTNIVLVLDSSRSMWGQIDGKNKVVIAREVISESVRSIEGKAKLGLVSYGHRQSAGCSDVELLLEPAQRPSSDIAEAVKSIKPKGSTPIAEALVTAARAARYEEEPAALMLIADGLDNCNADPCQMASELNEKGKDLTIHAIGFDSKNADKLTALNCIAENTGGTFAIARNEAELAQKIDTAFDAALTPPMPKIAAKAAQLQAEHQAAVPRSDPVTTGAIAQAQLPDESAPNQPPPIAAPKQGAAAPKGDRSVPVTLSARTVEGGAIIKSGLAWWIYKNEKTKDGKYELVETFREGTPTANLAPGAYRIAATYGKVHLIKDIDVKPGHAIQEIFVLNAGGLRLNAMTQNGTVIPPNSVRYDIFADESESDQFGNRKVILRDASPGVVLRLNAGAYQVVSTYGDANAIVRADVTVEPGRLTDATINHSASKITFKLVTQPGGEALADTQWNILTPGGDLIKESAGALPSHILAAGNYKVVAQYKGKTYSREFQAEEGEAKQIEVVIQ